MSAKYQKEPDAATSETKLAATTGTTSDITDKRGYAARWHFSVRTIDNMIAKGLPHLAVGSRRVRILIPEADAWMRQEFGQQRRRPNTTRQVQEAQ